MRGRRYCLLLASLLMFVAKTVRKHMLATTAQNKNRSFFSQYYA